MRAWQIYALGGAAALSPNGCATGNLLPCQDIDGSGPLRNPERDSKEIAMDVLGGRRILILEEQAPIAQLLVDMVREFGCEVIGPAKDVPHALALIATEAPEAAILDVKIAGRNTLAVAEELSRRRTPFAFTSGNKTPELARRFGPAPVVTKPYSRETMHSLLRELIGGSGQP